MKFARHGVRTGPIGVAVVSGVAGGGVLLWDGFVTLALELEVVTVSLVGEGAIGVGGGVVGPESCVDVAVCGVLVVGAEL